MLCDRTRMELAAWHEGSSRTSRGTSPSAWTVTLLIYAVFVDHVRSPERSNAPRYSFVLLMYCWCLSRESRVAPTFVMKIKKKSHALERAS